MKNKKRNNIIIFALFSLVIISVIIYLVITRNDKENGKIVTGGGNGDNGEDNDNVNLNLDLKNSYSLSNIKKIAMTPDGSKLTVLLVTEFEVYDINSRYETVKISTGVDMENFFTSLADLNDIQISENGEIILVSNNSEFNVFKFNGTTWNLETVNELDRRENGGIALSPNGLIYCANGQNSVSMEINCSVIGDGSRFRNNILLPNEAGELNSSTNSFTKLALNKDNSRLAYTSFPTSEIYLFSPDPNDSNIWSSNIQKLGGVGPREIAFSPDGKYLGVLWNKYITVYNVEEENRTYEVFNKSYNSTLTNINMSNEVIAFSTSENLTIRQDFKNNKSIDIDGSFFTQMSANSDLVVLGDLNENRIDIYA
ncbi:MAG: lactonase family protein [Arcobacter sp.]|nr:lactonase family protein [Flavobacteriaceae bacterium]MCP4971962.1 lactonase family protein [Arcobacter sp.]